MFDITRHNGLTQSLISSAQAYSSPYAAEIQEWYATPEQVAHLKDLTVHTVNTYGVQLWPTIRDRITELASNGHADSIFHVLSFDRSILLNAADLAGPTLTVRSYSLSMLRAGGVASRPTTHSLQRQITSTSSSPVMSVREAAELTKRVLAARGHDSRDRAMYLASLRPLLVQYDRRANKVTSDPSSVRLISEIVRLGRFENWLASDGTPPGVRIWLQTPMSAGVSTAPTTASVSTADHGTRSVTSGTQDAGAPPDAGRQRTLQMIACLKTARIYSPKGVRDRIFSSLRSLIEQGNLFPLAATQLVRRARVQAEEEAKKAGVSYDYWPVAGEAILELLLSAGVLVDEGGSAIKAGLRARGTAVASIDPKFGDKCEEYLLKFVIAKLGDVTKHDRTSLAHALFKVARAEKSLDDMLDRVDELFSILDTEIVEDADGKLKLRLG